MTWTKPVINSIDPAGLVGDDCDLKGGQFYEHCRAISECHLCNNNPVCSNIHQYNLFIRMVSFN